MSLDSGLVGQTAAELMDALEADGIEGTIDVVAIIVSVECSDETFLRFRCSDERTFVQGGLLRAAQVINEMGWTDS